MYKGSNEKKNKNKRSRTMNKYSVSQKTEHKIMHTCQISMTHINYILIKFMLIASMHRQPYTSRMSKE